MKKITKFLNLKYFAYAFSFIILINLIFFIYFNYKLLEIFNINKKKEAYCYFYNKYEFNLKFLDLFGCADKKKYIINKKYFKENKVKKIIGNHKSYIVTGDKSASSIKKDLQENNDWFRSHKNESSNKFYKTSKINKKNVDQLKIKWKYDLKGEWTDIKDFIDLLYARIFYSYTGHNPYNPINNIHGANPIFHNGNLFLPDLMGNVVSINGSNGKENWKKRLPVPVAKRGITIDENKNYLFVPSGNGIFKLNSINGKILDIYKVKEKSFEKEINKYGVSAVRGSNVFLVPPVVIEDQLVAVNMNSQVISFSLETKKINWVIPLRKENFKKGAHPWSAISYDKNRKHLYVVTGNPQSKNTFMLGFDREGNNLYSNSVVCIDVIKEKIEWYFQDTSHDLWDLDISFPPILSTLEIENKKIDILTVVSKSGNTFVLNRENGKNIFDYEMISVKQSKVLNELTSIYQKKSKFPPPLINMEIKKDELSNLSREIKNYVKDNYKDGKSGYYIPPILNSKIFLKGPSGGGQWYGGSVNTIDDILYVPINNIPWELELKLKNKKDQNTYDYDELSEFDIKNNNLYYQTNPAYFYDQYKNFATHPPWGFLYSIDLKKGEILWKIPYGKILANISDKKKKLVNGSPIWGGIASTSSGLIIASGSFDSKLYFYNSKKGEEIHSIQLGAPGSSPPIIYEYNGNLFISVVAVGAAQTVNKGRYIYGIGF